MTNQIYHFTGVQEVASNKPNTSTAFNLPGSAVAPLVTFASKFSNGQLLPYRATDLAGSAYEEGIGTFTTGSPNTLVRTAIFESSNSNAAVDFSGAGYATLTCTMPAAIGMQANKYSRGGIRGLGLTYNSTTALDIAAGSCMISGVDCAFSAATVTSASTMKNLNNATVTLGASKAYHVYAWNNAGAMQFAIQDWSDGTYGGSPTYDVDNDYYKAAYSTVGLNARRIGKFWTDGSSHILPFVMSGKGKRRRTQCGMLQIVTDGSAGSDTVITITPWATADNEQIIVALQMGPSTGFVSLSDGTVVSASTVGTYAQLGNGTNYGVVPPFDMNNTGTLKYRVSGGSCEIFLAGFIDRV